MSQEKTVGPATLPELRAMAEAKKLFMVGTGTGLAPFPSVLRDTETHEKFDKIIITHTVREEQELAYRNFLEEETHDDEIYGELLRDEKDKFDRYFNEEPGNTD